MNEFVGIPPQITNNHSSRSELDFVIENMRQGLWRLDPFGVILYSNPYLAEWLETTSEEMCNQHFSRYRSLRPLGDQHVEKTLSQRYEAEFKTKTGILRRAIVVTSPAVNSNGEPVGTVDLITDITAEHAVQTKLVQEVQRMSHLASIDSLTGASNRHVFDTSLQALIDTSEEEPFALIIVDVDSFKEINDVYGHGWGDMVLVEVAERIRFAVRDKDVVARFGGDEFATLLPNATQEALFDVVERLQKQLTFTIAGNGHPIKVRVSIGSAHSEDGSRGILHAADQQMYRQKNSRKARLA